MGSLLISSFIRKKAAVTGSGFGMSDVTEVGNGFPYVFLSLNIFTKLGYNHRSLVVILDNWFGILTRFEVELRPVRPSGQGPRVTAPKFRVRSMILRLGSGTIFTDQGIPSKTRVL